MNATEEKKAAHTPGPWMFRDGADPTHRMIFDSSGASGIARVITKIHEYGKDYPAEARANGNLMAAAPELLSACRAAAGELAAWEEKIRPMTPAGYEPRTVAVLKQVRAAISAAEGSSL